MRRIDFSEIRMMDTNFRGIEIFAENWTKRNRFSWYEKTPRPSCALFLISADIHATFYPVGKEPIHAERDDVVLIPQGSRYRVEIEGGTGSDIHTYTINFSPFDASGEELLLADSICVPVHAHGNLLELRAKKLFEVYHRIESLGEQSRNHLRIKAEFFALLDEVTALLTERAELYYPIRIGADALRKEWNRNEKIETYAAMCGISPAYFYQCFRQWSGKSPVEYRNLLRLSSAETMLRYTDMRVNEIATLVGFEDPFYFCRVFTAHFGLSPQGYRKSYRKNHD